MNKRGQIGLEYMIVVGFVTVILMSLLSVSYFHSKRAEVLINTNQIDSIAREIVEASESMFYYGEPSRTSIKVFIPKGIKNVVVGPNELTFVVRTPAGDSDISHVSDVMLQGNISSYSGVRSIKIEARSGFVWINGT